MSALEGETFPLWFNAGKGFFVDATYPSQLGLTTARRSGWGLGFYDFNNDGFKDLLSVNSHVTDNIELYNEQKYRQPNSVFANRGNGTFQDVSSTAGRDFQSPGAHRGCAFADFNNDGKIDAVVSALNELAKLFLNESLAKNHWLGLRLVGTQSNREGLGARITLHSGDIVQQNHATTSVGYASSSDRRVHFGLGSNQRIRRIEIHWPSGLRQVLEGVLLDQVLTISEPPKQESRP